jgi:DNA polymerase-3 subunit alpha
MTLDLSAPAGENHVLLGVLSSLRTHLTKNQKEMAFGTLEDYRGSIDLVFFERCWEINRDKLIENTSIALKGKLDLSRDKPSFLVSSVLDLGKMRRAAKAEAPPNGKPGAQIPEPSAAGPEKNAPVTPPSQEVHIRLCPNVTENERSLYPLRDYLIENPGTAPVFIHVPPSAKDSATENAAANGKNGEEVIRADTQLNITANTEQLAALRENSIVAEVWLK